MTDIAWIDATLIASAARARLDLDRIVEHSEPGNEILVTGQPSERNRRGDVDDAFGIRWMFSHETKKS